MRGVFLSLLGLTACSGGGGPDNAPDLAGAANQAEATVARYAAASDADRHGAAAAPRDRAAAVPAPAVAPSDTPSAAEPASATTQPTEPGAADAAALVRRYGAAIAAGDYRAAWAMWQGHGRASGMSPAAFAASFAGYARYQLSVGMPFDADAGAGQRYITVPVRVAARLKTGQRLALAGPIVLHRVADGIDTPDPADHRWAIQSADLAAVGKPAGLQAETPDAVAASNTTADQH